MILATKIKGYLLDLDGTVYTSDELIPGADHAIAELQSRNIPFRFVTNTTSKPRKRVVEKLGDLGIDVPSEHIFTAPAVAADYLTSRKITRCYFLLRPSLLADMPEVVADDEDPEAVLVGDLGDDFTYNKLNRAFRFVLDGATFISLAQNRYFKKPEGLFMDVGAFVAALEYATGQSAECIGKPSKTFFEIAALSMNLDLEEVAMIGDDPESDVLGAQKHGLTGVQVRTGKFDPEWLERLERKPDHVIDSIAELPL